MNDTRMTDDQAFQDIYGGFRDKIHRYLARLVGEGDAEDVTQEVFFKIHAALRAFRGEASLSTWIYRIARNAATDHLRKKKALVPERREDNIPEDETILCLDGTAADRNLARPDRQLIRKEMSECVRGIIDSLPDTYRTVLVLSDIDELSNGEIAKALDISLETVKIRLHRARARLRTELEHHCSFYKDDRNELACEPTSPLPMFPRGVSFSGPPASMGGKGGDTP